MTIIIATKVPLERIIIFSAYSLPRHCEWHAAQRGDAPWG